ncbi:DUF4287 domain-containing protein [Peteryoungia desertarenae]|uniref:DUF4287 domain-containing protein n=1 Tax=Peteryoungia desertarenae TaxID=1813451 RepID=A0ABX6QQA8_9HYPH|nr:DUF4287 domain-containing protein [Peteryoungia desertarenae]QLF70486.1 DUF4287 domain-containing protein [Peteryoungia desertarenae]
MALTPAEMDAAVIANLAARTGKDINRWIGLLENAPPFAKPAAAVAWLKVEHGLGQVTAQIIVRKWKDRGRADPEGDPVVAVLGECAGVLFLEIVSALAADVPNLQIMPRKNYVGLGTPIQFAVAARPRSSATLLCLGLVAQDKDLAPLPEAPRLGGSDRFKLLLDIASEDDIETALAHLRAAASGERVR